MQLGELNRGTLSQVEKRYDFVVIGGGMAGLAAAVTAARRGLRTALVQDRPVLGGNAGKEIRVWLMGANGGVNNRYFRETGLMEELRLENLFWNQNGNAEHWHITLHNLAMGQPNLDLYLNTVVTEVQAEGDRIVSVTGHTLASETQTIFHAPYFADCTGDGTVGYLGGAEWTSGIEGRSLHGETLAPEEGSPHTLGGTIMFLAKNAGRPVEFRKPDWAYSFTEEDLAHRSHSHTNKGIDYWWIEYGGMHDTIKDNEAIKTELWRIVYGMWDHLKNAEEHRDYTRNLELEWVGTIPGKRESRRFVGPYVLKEHDILNQTKFDDGVAYGGWSIDSHPPRGFWDKSTTPSNHIEPAGVYSIPLRCLYSINVSNLFFAGRNASVSRVALCSTRVMLTCAQMGEAAGAAVYECIRSGTTPKELNAEQVGRIRQYLMKQDHWIPGLKLEDPGNLAAAAKATASSEHALEVEPSYGMYQKLIGMNGLAVMFPVMNGRIDTASLYIEGEGMLRAVFSEGDEKGNGFPVRPLKEFHIEIPKDSGPRWIEMPLNQAGLRDGWHFLELHGEGLSLCISKYKLPGAALLVPNHHKGNHYSAWIRPGDYHSNTEGAPCLRVSPAMGFYDAGSALDGYLRPDKHPHLWISANTDFRQPEWLELAWEQPRSITELHLAFDTDLDSQLTNLWVEYPSRAVPSCVRNYEVELFDGSKWVTILSVKDNYQRKRIHQWDKAIVTSKLRIAVTGTWGAPYASIYDVQAYG